MLFNTGWILELTCGVAIIGREFTETSLSASACYVISGNKTEKPYEDTACAAPLPGALAGAGHLWLLSPQDSLRVAQIQGHRAGVGGGGAWAARPWWAVLARSISNPLPALLSAGADSKAIANKYHTHQTHFRASLPESPGWNKCCDYHHYHTPLYNWGNWGTERSNNSPKIIQVLRGPDPDSLSLEPRILTTHLTFFQLQDWDSDSGVQS